MSDTAPGPKDEDTDTFTPAPTGRAGDWFVKTGEPAPSRSDLSQQDQPLPAAAGSRTLLYGLGLVGVAVVLVIVVLQVL